MRMQAPNDWMPQLAHCLQDQALHIICHTIYCKNDRDWIISAWRLLKTASSQTVTVDLFKIEMHAVLTRFRIMVLDGGKIKEFDTPQALLADHQSLFYSLAKEANIIANTKNNDQSSLRLYRTFV